MNRAKTKSTKKHRGKLINRWLLIVLFTLLLAGATAISVIVVSSYVNNTSPDTIDVNGRPVQDQTDGVEAPPANTEPAPADTVTGQQATETPPLPGKPVWVDPALPDFISEALTLPDGWRTGAETEAQASLTYGEGSNPAQWVLALTVPFASTIDEVSGADLQALWQGSAEGSLAGRSLLVSEDVYYALSHTWGFDDGEAVNVVDEDTLLQTAWQNGALAVIPFEKLEPRWKVLAIDGQSPIRNDFNAAEYALTIPVSLQGDQANVQSLLLAAQSGGVTLYPAGNRDPSKLTVLAMTGVTALARSTAYTMEQEGVTYPGQDVQPLLSSADITHISHEVSFANNCPSPRANQTSLMFCADPKYIELLEFIGTDIIEFTGDHLADWGQRAIVLTLDMYAEEGWPVYGGGYNLEEGRQPVTWEHNGNKLAFIGCNAKGEAFTSAGTDTAGAVPCDFTYVRSEIEILADQGYLPIVSIQHNEYNLYEAQEVQIRDFRRLAESGAIIISGSQSHQPQGMEFYEGAFLHYGLGNLFFDQYSVSRTLRNSTIDMHVFYNNRYISTELYTTYLIDYARPRVTGGEERAALLETLFSASGWDTFQ